MAIMFPSHSSYAKSRGEANIFAILKRLDDSFICLMNVPWSIPRENKNGEIDFVILHPSYPMLIVEVKDGKLACNGGFWKQNERHMDESPIDQAMRNRANYIKTLLDYNGFPKNTFIPTSWLVVLPDTPANNLLLNEGAREQIFTADHVAKGHEVFLKYLNDQREHLKRSQKNDSIGNQVWSFLKNIFVRTPKFDVPRNIAFSEEKELFEQIAASQLSLLGNFELVKKAVFFGGAGTGKTVLAIEKALRCASDGKRTLLSCYNDLLERNLKESVGNASVTVMNFHHLCEFLISKTGAALPSKHDASQYYDVLLPNAAYEAISAHPELRYDAIIIDEFQDIREEWFLVLDALLSGQDGDIFYAFGDGHQLVQAHGLSVPEQNRAGVLPVPAGFVPAKLIHNFRNTKSIYSILNGFFLGPKGIHLTPLGPQGNAVEFEIVTDERSLLKNLSSILDRLTRKDQIPASDIVILTGGAKNKSVIKEGQTIGRHNVSTTPNGENEILFETARRFKGLERKVVIVIELEGQALDLCYVALSRAMSLLIVLGDNKTIGRLSLQAELPQSA